MRNLIDWPKLVEALTKTAGVSQQDIATKVGMSQAAVSFLAGAKTRNPPYDRGVALVDLYTTTFPDQPVPELATPTHPRADLALHTQGA